MSAIDGLITAYRRHVQLSWERTLSGPERTWIAIYEPAQERRLRLHVPAFELVTREAGHGWRLVDLTTAFAEWMAAHEYRDAYFEEPEYLDTDLDRFTAHVVDQLREQLGAPDIDDNTVVGVKGIASLYGLTRVSTVLELVAPDIRGRLLVFFPGHHDEGNNYRLLDARDGWNYLAVPIVATDGA